MGFDLREPPSCERECFLPARGAEFVALADQGSSQPIFAVNMPPAEFSLYTGGDSVGRALLRRHFENVPILRPNVKTAPHPAVGAHCFRFADAVIPHRRFRLGHLKDAAVAGFRFNAFDHVDHAVQDRRLQGSQETCVTQHCFFHQRIAGTNGDAVAARNAARLSNR